MPDKRFERRRAPAVTRQAGAAALPILLILSLSVPGLAGAAGDGIAGSPVLPQIDVSPDPIEFGDVPLDTPAEVEVTVTNTGDADLEMAGVGVNGDGLIQFSLGEDVGSCAVATVPPDATCQFSVRYTPAEIGDHTAILQIWSNAEPSPLVTDMSGSGVEPSAIVFESRAAGHTGGGLGISNTHFPGHTFRLLERTEVSALGGGNLSAFGAQSVFAALYQVATPDSTADVVGDSNLLDATLLDVPDGGPNDVTGALSLTLDPGWYALVTGTGRHGATAGDTAVSLENTGTATTPQSIGPYSMRSDTNARILQAATIRFFVEGETLPPEPPAESAFLMETAGPAAWWTQGSFGIDDTFFRGTRFEITATTRVDEVGAWMRSGSGQMFAALVELSGPGANPPPITSPGFSDSVVGATLIDVSGPPDAYTGDFGGLELTPGHYALILGSGLFGAGGTAGLMGVADQVVRPGSLTWTGSFWANSDSDFRFWLKGIMPQLAVAPAPVDFSDTVIGTGAGQTLTVTNTGSGPLVISSIALSGDNPLPFGLDDLAACISAALPPGGECSFTVTYAPTEAGDDTAVVQVFSDGVPSPFEVGLSGTGLEPEVPDLLILPQRVDFGEAGPGEVLTSDFLIIENEDVGTLILEDLLVTGVHADDFQVTPGADECSGQQLELAEFCHFTLDFSPLDAGVRRARLQVDSNDPGTPHFVELTGTRDVIFHDGFERPVPDGD